jgi:NAD(P)-dependent dehydrogenase (short-subunit alcohol dehydrogenase family)
LAPLRRAGTPAEIANVVAFLLAVANPVRRYVE